MPPPSDPRLLAILAKLALLDSHEEQEELGRGEMASALHRASLDEIDVLVKRARRDDRLRRCLAAARYYSGLGLEKCRHIDSVLTTPFPAAGPPRRKR